MGRRRWRGRAFRRRHSLGRSFIRCVANVAGRSMGRMGAISIRGGVRCARGEWPGRRCGRRRRDCSGKVLRSCADARGFAGLVESLCGWGGVPVRKKAGWSFRLRLLSGLPQRGIHRCRKRARPGWGTRLLRVGRGASRVGREFVSGGVVGRFGRRQVGRSAFGCTPACGSAVFHPCCEGRYWWAVGIVIPARCADVMDGKAARSILISSVRAAIRQ
jgi:hypothetical protein